MQPLEVRISDEEGRSVAAATQLSLQRADKRALDEPALAAALGQLGDNSLEMASLDTSRIDFSAGELLALAKGCCNCP